jgi:hypothetical protein
MIYQCQFGMVAVAFTQEEREQIAYHATQATLPVGRSKIFEGSAEQLQLRESERSENQYVGMACEAAFAKWAESLGSGGFAAFLATRERRNQNKFVGDGGVDAMILDGIEVDVKGSEPPKNFAFDERAALKLCLTHERDAPLARIADRVYVFALTQRELAEACLSPHAVLLAGWLYGRELYGRTDRSFLKGWSAAGDTLRKMHTLQAQAVVAPMVCSA